MKRFIDLCRITVIGGRGGNGLVSFRRERGRSRARPDGGDGGDGANVYLKADANLGTLYDFTHLRSFRAGHGGRGGSNVKKGIKGQGLILKVPVGTVVRENVNQLSDQEVVETRPILADLSGQDDRVLVARGGRGGRGNAHLPRSGEAIAEYKGSPGRFCQFKGRRRGDPKYYWAEKGEAGERKEIILELKLIADVGIVGLPNAGKTTLLNRLTRSKAEIGEYPFTTLSPNLGVLVLDRRDSFQRRTKEISQGAGRTTLTLADIPGLVEGASEGKGLGDEFLRHTERTRVLLHLIDPLTMGDASRNISSLEEQAWRNYEIVRRELGAWSRVLLRRPELVVINKGDVTEVQRRFNKIRKKFEVELESSTPIILVSAVTGLGLDDLVVKLEELMSKLSERDKGDELINGNKLGSRSGDQGTNVLNRKCLLNESTLGESHAKINGVKTYQIGDLRHYKI